MSALDFTPEGTAAPRGQQIWAHARCEAGLILKNGEQALLALVIPVAILVGARFFGDRFGQGLAITAPSVLALASWSSGFVSLAIATGFERRYQVLERLAATPLGKSGILLGKIGSIALITTGQLILLALVAFGLGWRPVLVLPQLLFAALSLPLALICFAAFGLTLAGSLRAEITLALANLIYLVGMLTGAVLFPLASYPAWAQPAVALLPTAALGEALRSGAWWAPISLLLWSAAALLLARKVFRWTS